jgi:hypothetical protein
MENIDISRFGHYIMSAKRTNRKDLINNNRRQGDNGTIESINQENCVYPNMKTEKKRLDSRKKMSENKVKFNGKVLLLGFGGIGRPLHYQLM